MLLRIMGGVSMRDCEIKINLDDVYQKYPSLANYERLKIDDAVNMLKQHFLITITTKRKLTATKWLENHAIYYDYMDSHGYHDVSDLYEGTGD